MCEVSECTMVKIALKYWRRGNQHIDWSYRCILSNSAATLLPAFRSLASTCVAGSARAQLPTTTPFAVSPSVAQLLVTVRTYASVRQPETMTQATTIPATVLTKMAEDDAADAEKGPEPPTSPGPVPVEETTAAEVRADEAGGGRWSGRGGERAGRPGVGRGSGKRRDRGVEEDGAEAEEEVEEEEAATVERSKRTTGAGGT